MPSQAGLASMNAMLAAERATRADLARVKATAAAGVMRSPADAQARARAIQAGLTQTVTAGRERARGAGLVSMRGEWAGVRSGLVRAGVSPLAVPVGLRPSRQPDDSQLANAVAAAATGVFLANAERLLADGDTSAGAALPDYILDETAATQTSQAFNGERFSIEKALTVEFANSDWLPLVGKMWDATLDRRACPICRGKDGTLRPLGIDWDGQTPGNPHRRCRCIAIYLPVLLNIGAA